MGVRALARHGSVILAVFSGATHTRAAVDTTTIFDISSALLLPYSTLAMSTDHSYGSSRIAYLRPDRKEQLAAPRIPLLAQSIRLKPDARN